jgi:hypothetical protein
MVPNAKQGLLIARTLKISFIVSGLLFLYIVFKTPRTATAPPQSAIEIIISAIALTNVALGFILPGFIARSALRRQTSMLPSTTPIQSWISGYVLSLTFFESCMLFGVVLHFIGSRLFVVECLFAAGLLAIVFWGPGSPPIERGETTTKVFPGA